MPTALISVSDKSGLVELARELTSLGWDLLASGGTAQAIRAAGLPVQDVAEYTGMPELLGGRVKTLHPAVHAGILARPTADDATDLESIGARLIDLVVVNLYPFEKTVAREGSTLEESVENIDIGGVALIRAAGKNYDRVAVLTDPQDYTPVLEEIRLMGLPGKETRYRLARKAFAHTASYDAAISAYLGGSSRGTQQLHLALHELERLRYGENPHQEAALYGFSPDAGPLGGKVLQGKALSFSNILDLDVAWRASLSFYNPTIVIVKHGSPCGIASAASLAEAFPHALESDPVSAFGGVIAANRPLDAGTVTAFGTLFIECVAAPGFSAGALELLEGRKKLRLLSMPDAQVEPVYELRSVNRGVLRQFIDAGDPAGTAWKVVSKRPPSDEEYTSLRFAWKACQHVKSNAIVFARGEATVGIGGGQPNRVDCVRIAAARAGEKAKGAVMASDAFFPFPDSVEEAAKAGITAVIEPGGSVRDQEAVDAADAYQMALIFTGVRHFRH